jgi:hypothetical protein
LDKRNSIKVFHTTLLVGEKKRSGREEEEEGRTAI